MQNFNCFILGSENSGKSSYINQFVNGIADSRFSPFHIEHNNIQTVNGKENPGAYYNNSFKVDVYEKLLSLKTQDIFSFSISDYAGKIIEEKNEQSESYKKLNSDLHDADFLIVMLDGDLFSGESKEKTVKKIKRKCSRHYTPLISVYSENKLSPEITFVVTKCKNVFATYDEQSALNIVKESFDGVFVEDNDNQPQITFIENFQESGLFIPLATAMKHFINIIGNQLNDNLDEQNKKLQDAINDNEDFLREQEDRLLLKNPFKMKEAREKISSLKHQIQCNENIRSESRTQEFISDMNNILSREQETNRKFIDSIFNPETTPAPATTEKDSSCTGCIAIIVLLIIIIFILVKLVSCGANFIKNKKDKPDNTSSQITQNIDKKALYFDDDNMLVIDTDIIGQPLKKVKKKLGNELDVEPEYNVTSYDEPVYNYKFLHNDGFLQFTFDESYDRLLKVQFFDYRSFDDDVYDTACEMYGKPTEHEGSYTVFNVDDNTDYGIMEATADGETVFVQAYAYTED